MQVLNSLFFLSVSVLRRIEYSVQNHLKTSASGEQALSLGPEEKQKAREQDLNLLFLLLPEYDNYF